MKTLFMPPRLLDFAVTLGVYFEGVARRPPRALLPQLVRLVRRRKLRRPLMETIWR
jgi:hypothetical protein